MPRSSRLTGIVVALLAIPAAASPARAEVLDRVCVYANVWYPSLGGTARIDSAVPGTEFDVVEDAGLDDEGPGVELGAFIRPAGRHSLLLAGLAATLDGGGSLAREIRAGDRTFLPGTEVSSKIDFRLGRALYGYTPVHLKVVRVGLLAGVDYLDADADLAAVAVGTSSASVRGATPVVGANVAVSPPAIPLRIYAELTGASWKVGDVEAEILDAGVRVEWYFLHAFGIGAGYRKLDIEASKDGEGRVDVSTDGYQLYLLLRF